ncbi:MAG: terpene cyclase/mutase family protein [Planctomycetales bacterium]|nr:terpene cyclase/mutase family protein [Planctomycetales bacterium]
MKSHAIVNALFLVLACCEAFAGAAEPDASRIRLAVERSLSLLERTSATTAEMRTCFTCHGQAHPVFAMVEAKRRGIHINPENLERQVEHTYSHLSRGKDQYEAGKGQGGQVDTAGYALWTLEDGDRDPDEVTDAVVDYLLKKQDSMGNWARTSNRPPTEASSFTSTYLALRALSAFGRETHQARIEDASSRAGQWLAGSSPLDTEDSVFQLLSFDYVNVQHDVPVEAIEALIQQQRSDGGWAQLASMESDAYATATVLYALHRSGIPTGDDAWTRGLKYLLETQQQDGSWHVATRSKPFQKYFESGFPHGADQFISTSATAWATLALLFALPEQPDLKVDAPEATATLTHVSD